MNPVWQDFLVRQGARLDETGVAHFGNPHGELQAVQGTIMADLSHLGLLEVAGDDAAAFLQGQLTNDIKQLNGQNSQYAGYCTAKGRLLALFLVYARDGRFRLQCNGAIGAAVLRRLKMYVLRSKVSITDASDSVMRIGIAGADAPGILRSTLGLAPEMPHDLACDGDTHVLRLPGPLPRFEILTATEAAVPLWERLRAHCTPVGAAVWDNLEIRAGIPDITAATQEAFVPQMVNLDALGGISFKKGCYTGQEIVARTHYLGKVKRRTQLAHVACAVRPLPGAPVYGADSTEPVGMVVRSAPAAGGGFDLLAEARLESVAAGDLHCQSKDGPALQLLAPPYAME